MTMMPVSTMASFILMIKRHSCSLTILVLKKKSWNKASFVSSIFPLEKFLNFSSFIAELNKAYERTHPFTQPPARCPSVIVYPEK